MPDWRLTNLRTQDLVIIRGSTQEEAWRIGAWLFPEDTCELRPVGTAPLANVTRTIDVPILRARIAESRAPGGEP